MFGKRKRLIGVDIGSHAIKAVLVRRAGKGGVSFDLEKIALEPVAPQVIVEGDIIDSVAVIEVLDRMLREMRLRVNDVAISLSGNSVIIKKISVPKMNPDELEDSIQWEAEQYIPFEIDDVMVDYHPLVASPDGNTMDVVLVAVKKDKVNDYTSVISQVGKQTGMVDVDVFAIQNCFEVNYPDMKGASVGLVNIGASVTSINIVENGTTAFWRDLMIGGNRHTEALQRSLGLGVEQAEDAKRGFEVGGAPPDAVVPVLDKASEEIVEMIAKTFDFYSGSAEHATLERVFAGGGAACTPGMLNLLSTKLATPVELLDPFRNISINPHKFDVEYIRNMAPNFTVSVGLAVREVDD
jgi:type IV pilus assembly protein PilM